MDDDLVKASARLCCPNGCMAHHPEGDGICGKWSYVAQARAETKRVIDQTMKGLERRPRVRRERVKSAI